MPTDITISFPFTCSAHKLRFAGKIQNTVHKSQSLFLLLKAMPSICTKTYLSSLFFQFVNYKCDMGAWNISLETKKMAKWSRHKHLLEEDAETKRDLFAKFKDLLALFSYKTSV